MIARCAGRLLRFDFPLPMRGRYFHGVAYLAKKTMRDFKKYHAFRHAFRHAKKNSVKKSHAFRHAFRHEMRDQKRDEKRDIFVCVF